MRVWDQAEFATLISSPLTFKKDTTPPAKVGLATPMDKSNVNPDKNTNLTLRWNQVSDLQSGVAGYRIALDDNADLSSPLFERDLSVLSTTWELPNGNGTYYWRVRALDNCGLEGEWSNVWSIVLSSTATNLPPVAKAGSVLFGAPGKPVTFDGSKSYDPEGESLTFEWDFDLSDGLSYKTMTTKPQNTYGTAGNYTATLKVTDPLGQFDTDTVLVAITKDGEPINITPPPDDDDVTPDDDVAPDDDITPDDDIIVDRNDTDSDGLPDAWEIKYFSGKDYGPNDDPDEDGVTNLEEYQAGTDPTKKHMADDDVDDDTDDDVVVDDDNQSLDPKMVGFSLLALLVLLVLVMVIIGIVVQRRKKRESEARADKWRRDDAARRSDTQRARPPTPNYAQYNKAPEYASRPNYATNQQSIYETPKKQAYDPALYEAFAAVKAQTAPMATKPAPSKPSGLRGAAKKQEQPKRKAPPPPPVEEEAPELDEVEEPTEELPEMEPVEEEVNWEEPEGDGEVNWEDTEDEVDFDEPSKADPDDEWDNTDASDVSFDDE